MRALIRRRDFGHFSEMRVYKSKWDYFQICRNTGGNCKRMRHAGFTSKRRLYSALLFEGPCIENESKD